jgi:hypothetical protein
MLAGQAAARKHHAPFVATNALAALRHAVQREFNCFWPTIHNSEYSTKLRQDDKMKR